jgi:tetratricopeptide (TPR) repeat protein
MFHQIAWTPYAERYLYIPLAFFLPPLVIFSGGRLPVANNRLTLSLVTFVIVVFSVTSYQRAETWSTNLALWKDTSEKSPYSIPVINDYGLALMRLGMLDEAIKQFGKAVNQQRGVEYSPRYGLNLGIALMKAGNYDESRDAFVAVLDRKKGKSAKAKEYLKELYSQQIEGTFDDDDVRRLKNELGGLLEKYDQQKNKEKTDRVM